MFLEKIHTAFHLFLESSKKFTRSEKEHIHILFEKDIIKKIFNFAIIFFFWSFIAVWIDSLLFSKGIIHGVHEMMFHFDQFFPVIIFSLTNAVLKYIFIYFYLGKLNIIKPEDKFSIRRN